MLTVLSLKAHSAILMQTKESESQLKRKTLLLYTTAQLGTQMVNVN